MKLSLGRFRWDIRNMFLPQKLLGTAQAPQGMGTAVQNSRSVWVPLPGCSGWDFGVSGQGQGLDQ